MRGKATKGFRPGIDPITIRSEHVASVPLYNGLINKKYHNCYPAEFTSMHPELLIHRDYPTYISHPDGRIELLPDNWRRVVPIVGAKVRRVLFGQNERHRETWPYIFFEGKRRQGRI